MQTVSWRSFIWLASDPSLFGKGEQTMRYHCLVMAMTLLAAASGRAQVIRGVMAVTGAEMH